MDDLRLGTRDGEGFKNAWDRCALFLGGLDVPVTAVAGGAALLALALFGGDDGLEVLALPALLAPAAIGGVRNLLGLLDGSLLNICGAVHGEIAGDGGCLQRRQRWWVERVGAGARAAAKRGGR